MVSETLCTNRCSQTGRVVKDEMLALSNRREKLPLLEKYKSLTLHVAAHTVSDTVEGIFNNDVICESSQTAVSLGKSTKINLKCVFKCDFLLAAVGKINLNYL